MIPVSEALKLIESFCKPAKKVMKPIEKSMGLVLSEDIISPINMPPFKQSSMDGYAFIHSEHDSYRIVDEIQAGHSKNVSLNAGEAVRIFTGARIPDDADTVVMQEHTQQNKKGLNILTLPEKGTNVRAIGEQIKVGDMALKKGTLLHEAAIGFLAGLGITKIPTYKIPKVSILITGDELQTIGKTLKEGQVYDSNSMTLKLALKQLGIKNINVVQVKDNLKATTKTIKKSLKNADIILISGGISVGDYDFVKQGLLLNNVKEVFYKVNQKPGKPLWFGHKDNTLVFALPGNPASSLSCFYMYVVPILRAKLGFENYHLKHLKAKASLPIKNSHNKTLFLKAMVDNGKVTVLSGQASSMLKSFAIANALVMIPEDKKLIKKGEQLTYIAL